MVSDGGVVSATEMARCRGVACDSDEVVVFTNGCFDLLHPGHIRYLTAARALGSILYVGVNGDASEVTNKGMGRPFNSASERAEVVAALRAVDAVTVFDEPTAEALVGLIKPDIYVKGGDYSADPQSPQYPIEGHVVTGYGGRVQVLDLEAGYSTSRLIARIQEHAETCCEPGRITRRTT